MTSVVLNTAPAIPLQRTRSDIEIVNEFDGFNDVKTAIQEGLRAARTFFMESNGADEFAPTAPVTPKASSRRSKRERRDNKKTSPKQEPEILLGLSHIRQLRRGIVPKGINWSMVKFREGEKTLYEKAAAAEARTRINGVPSRAPKRRLKLNCAPALI